MDGPPPQGELTFVDNSVDATTGMIQLKATFPNEDGALVAGTVCERGADAFGIDQRRRRAVAGGADGTERPVHLRREAGSDGGGTAGHRPASLIEGETVVQSGVKAGETVVTDGQLRLEPGVKVSVKSK